MEDSSGTSPQQKNPSEALLDSEERFTITFRSIPDALVISRLEDGTIIKVSDHWLKLFGYSREEIIGQNFFTLNLFADSADLRRINDLLGEQGFVRDLDIRIRQKSGALRTATLSIESLEVQGIRYLLTSFHDITDLKSAEAKLRQQTDAMEAAIDGMAILNAEEKYVYLNNAHAGIYGYENAGELVGKTWRILYAPDETQRFEREIMPELGRKGNWRGEAIGVKKDGSRFPQEVSLTAMADGGLICVVRDITEQKRVEEALRKSEEYFRTIIENTSDVIFIVDELGTINYASPSIERFAGYSPDELIGTSGFDLILPDDLPRAIAEFGRAILIKEVPVPNSFRIRHKDGTERIFEGIGINLTDNHAVGGFVMNLRDITDRKRAAALLKSETMLKSVFQAVPLAIAVADTDRVLRNVNDGMCEMFGYPRDEMVGRNVRFLYFSDEEYNEAREVLYNDPGTAGSSSIEVRMRRKDGAEICVLLSASSLRTEDTLTGAVVACMDVTARKSIEAQLRQAQKMEAIGTLAGGIAHDFNNILSAIMGYTDMALMDPRVEDQLRRYLEQVFKASERARDLVKQILAFSRQSDEKPCPLRVSPIIKEVLKLLRASLPATIAIHQNIQSEPDTVLADPTQIHQIMMNLCANAAHAMRKTKGILKVSLSPVGIKPFDSLIALHGLKPGMYLKLSVGDTGTGIAPDIMGRIFDPFFTTKRPGEGTGMGLSVVHGIVKSCNGTVTVESEAGNGTEFHVYLPLLIETAEKGETETAEDITGGKERILLVDDDEAIAQLGKITLTGLGYDVTETTNGLEALEIFKSSPCRFDLVITDMTMPNMTGIELAQEIMRIRPGMPVILCTGFSDAITPEKARDVGLREFIMKPVILRRIAAAIRRELDRKE